MMTSLEITNRQENIKFITSGREKYAEVLKTSLGINRYSILVLILLTYSLSSRLLSDNMLATHTWLNATTDTGRWRRRWRRWMWTTPMTTRCWPSLSEGVTYSKSGLELICLRCGKDSMVPTIMAIDALGAGIDTTGKLNFFKSPNFLCILSFWNIGNQF